MKRQFPDNTIQIRQLLLKRRRTRDAVMTTLLWILYAYLWLPLVSFIAWFMGIDFAYERVIKAGGPEELILLLLWFVIAFLLVLLIVVVWSSFQFRQHHGDKDRRNRTVDLDPDDEREHWGLDQTTLDRLKSSQVVTVSLEGSTAISEVREGSPPRAEA